MKMKCGFSQIDITPPTPSEVFQDGFGTRVLPAESILDPLFAKVCVLQYGTREFALVSMDICGMSADVKERLCGWVVRMTGLKREQFALCATHTHSGPACGVLANLPINGMYWNWVGRLVSEAIDAARKNTTPGVWKSVFGAPLTAGFNRRGKEYINRNTTICGFWDENGELRGSLVSASCHPVCMNEYCISADYPGVLTRRAEERYPGVPFLFLQGRTADIDPPGRGQELMNRIGNELSDIVFDALKAAQKLPGISGPMKSLFQTVDISMEYPGKDALLAEIPQHIQEMQRHPYESWERRYPEICLQWIDNALRFQGDRPRISADFQAVQIGDSLLLVLIPFEILTVTGNAIEAELTDLGFCAQNCLIIGYANGTNGYLCPKEDYPEYNYETREAPRWYMLPQCCPESEEEVIHTVVNLVKTLLSQ